MRNKLIDKSKGRSQRKDIMGEFDDRENPKCTWEEKEKWREWRDEWREGEGTEYRSNEVNNDDEVQDIQQLPSHRNSTMYYIHSNNIILYSTVSSPLSNSLLTNFGPKRSKWCDWMETSLSCKRRWISSSSIQDFFTSSQWMGGV